MRRTGYLRKKTRYSLFKDNRESRGRREITKYSTYSTLVLKKLIGLTSNEEISNFTCSCSRSWHDWRRHLLWECARRRRHLDIGYERFWRHMLSLYMSGYIIYSLQSVSIYIRIHKHQFVPTYCMCTYKSMYTKLDGRNYSFSCINLPSAD
jgi:hypothetical protein